VRQRRPHAAQRRHEVDGQRGRPVLVADRQEPVETRPDGTDVVDQDVEPVVPGDRLVDQVPRPVRLGQVDLDHVYVEAVGEQVELVAAVQRAGHDGGTFLGQRSGDRETDALAGAGDHDDLAVQVQVHGRRPSVRRRVTLSMMACSSRA
jgi:hypothetical protein